MLRWPLVFLIAALVAGVLGFSGVAAAATNIAIILFFVFGALFLIALLAGPTRHAAGRVTRGVGGLLAMVAAVALAIWLSDNYSLETAGEELDESLAEARSDIETLLDDPDEAVREARDELADAIDEVEEAVEPQ